MSVRELSDQGRPIVVTDPASPAAEAFRQIADRTWAELQDAKSDSRPAPRIVIEN
jgi:ATP-binding protein involved in chromosome partitioning